MAVLFQTRSDSELACSRKTPSSATASIAAGRRRPVTEPHPGVHRRDGPGQPSCFTSQDRRGYMPCVPTGHAVPRLK